MTPSLKCKPVVLIILDGWGIGLKKRNNAVSLARTPVFDRLWSSNPHSTLQASGRAVGLPSGQTGNSEAGHMNIGAGRIVEQDAIEISHRINDGSFFRNPAFLYAVEHVKKNNSSMHLAGLLTGDQSAHAYPEHLHALLQLLAGYQIKKVFLHLFTDGRDSSPHGATKFIEKLQKHFLGDEKIATVIGRFYAMDRVKEWGRVKLAYEAMVEGKGWNAPSAQDAITQAYNRGENDEYIHPTVICKDGEPVQLINNNDGIIFFNIRSDRVREISKAFLQKEEFTGFERKKILSNIAFVTLTDYGPDLPGVRCAYPFRRVVNTLPFVFGSWRQLYISESEKYAHVTYFLNGGYPSPVAGEERVIIQSPRLYSYVQKPEMSSLDLTDFVLSSLENDRYDIIVMNYPNADMVGHTGDIPAAVQAVEYLDFCMGRIEAMVRRKKGVLFITADHGNADYMMNLQTGEINTSHSHNPVPFIMTGDDVQRYALQPKGVLANIAPTILDVVGIPKPPDMTSQSLCITKSNQ